MKKYQINEIFYSLQGEGINAGRAAVFIRFAGCNLACSFCDTDWSHGSSLDAKEITKKAISVCNGNIPALVVLTGGEPGLQIDRELLAYLRQQFEEIAIETNGTQFLPEGLDITISPKDDYCEKAECVLKRVTEVKVVFDGERNPEYWRSHILAEAYFLQPCDTGDEARNKEIINKCVRYIKEHPWWRLSLQTHKIIGIQ